MESVPICARQPRPLHRPQIPALQVLFGGLAGAAMDAGMQYLSNVMSGRDPIKCMDLNSILWSGIEGAIGGILGDGLWGKLAAAGVSYAISIWGRGLSPEEALNDATFGFLFDIALSEGGKFIDDFTNSGGGGVGKDVGRRFDNNPPRYGDGIGDNVGNGRRYADDVADNMDNGHRYVDNVDNGGRHADNLDNGGRRHADDVDMDGDATVCPLNSFTGDTLVSTPDGEKPISEIEVGDMVLAYNEETGEIGKYPVTHVWSHEEDESLVTLSIDGEIIIATAGHPFYTSDGEWIAAGDLQIGTEVYSTDGTHGTLDALVITDGTAWVYNLTVDEAHTYFVGDGQWLVHNCPPTGDGGGNNQPPDLSSLDKKLSKILNKYKIDGGQCVACSRALENVLREAGFNVEIVTIRNMYVNDRIGRPSVITANLPDSSNVIVATDGYHKAIRIDDLFYIDALTFQHRGVQAVDETTYRSFWTYPQDIEITNG